MRTLSRARLSTKIVDNQLDAWLRFSVSLCERVQVQQHLGQRPRHSLHTTTLLKMLRCFRRGVVPPKMTVVPLLDVLYEAWSSSLIEFAWQWLLSACLLARYNPKLEHFQR